LGEYFGIDPTLFRLLFIVAALFGGPGLIAYLIFLIIVPQEPLEVADSPVMVTETELQEDETV
jgi:phage shock protein PspC (stress-responsive transcriptional regulator)